ncbi:MAG: class I SAM-dependent methyltransferase [Nanoarchaeota archaeon]|nr:class I SAM-dependent methyltransferase [Nanoarchaeota archaeon]
MNCRLCKSEKLEMFLDLGFTPPSDSFLTKPELNKPEIYYPLKVHICKDCCYMQLGYNVPGEILFCRNYPYDNSTSTSFRKHFFDLSKKVAERFKLGQNSLVVDIGSNVGILLSAFKELGMKVLGIDPARNIASKAIEKGFETIPEFFSSGLAKKIVKEKGKASIITATNVFVHIPDLDDFMEGIKILLDERGIFIFEVQYAAILIENLLYDMIYHEHLGYMSVKPIIPFIKKFDMEVFDIELVDTHGGSLRVYTNKKGKHDISPNIQEFIEKENKMKLYSLSTLKKFAEDVKKHRNDLVSLLLNLKKQGKTIVGVGAPAKGNTLLNYCKIDTGILDYITENAETKIGLYTPGTHIPIYPDDKLKEDKPDYGLLLSWNLANEIMKNLDSFKKQGGKFIIPMPHPRIVG